MKGGHIVRLYDIIHNQPSNLRTRGYCVITIDSQNYKQHSYREFSKIHQMTAYLAMFPPNLPHYFIKRFSKAGDLVFDPFSGRGTTAFEACRMGRIRLLYALQKAR